MTNTNLTTETLETIRTTLGLDNADLSRACSEALWGDTTEARRNARRRVARALAR